MGKKFIILSVSFLLPSRPHAQIPCRLWAALSHPLMVGLLLSSLSAIRLDAQRTVPQMEVVSVEQGLSSNTVHALCQDRKGFIWMGTGDGLCRYDGHGFKVFRQRPGDSLSLLSNYVNNLFEDREGVLWVGTPAGLCCYDPLHELFPRLLLQEKGQNIIYNNNITEIHEDRSGQLWVGTAGGGLNLFDREKRVFRAYFPDVSTPGYESQTIVTSLCNDGRHEDLMWVGMRVGTQSTLYRFNTRDKTFSRCDVGDGWGPISFQSIFEDRNGLLWLGTDRGVLLMDSDAKTTRKFDDFPNVPTKRVAEIRAQKDGTLWMLVQREGLFEYDPGRRRLTQYVQEPSVPGSLSNNTPIDILEDRSGVLWIATLGGGVNRWRREKERFQALQGDPSNPRYAVGGSVTALCEDGEGRLWIGTNWRGVDCLNRSTGRFEPMDFKTGDLRNAMYWVYSMAAGRDGRIWMGSNGRGLFCVDPSNKTYKTYLDKPAGPDEEEGYRYVHSLSVERTGVVWAGTSGGLYRFDPATETWTVYRHDPAQPNSLCHNAVYQVFEDRAGTLWVASQGGLSRMDRHTGTFQHFLYDPSDATCLRSGEIANVCDDRQGNLWAGTPRGLYRLQFPEKGKDTPLITHYTDQNGLLSNSICGVLEDGRGRLWISTVRGLSVFKNPGHDAKTPPDFQHYNLRDGLQDYTFVDRAFFKNQRGELFFGGEKGYNVFHPDSIRDNPHVPTVALTAFEKYDVGHPELGAIAVPGISAREEVALSYKNNIFTVSFAALDFRDPTQNRYAYQLEGFSNAWIQLGNQHQVTFTNLDPGTYFFRVKGSNNDGVWNEQPTVLKIVVHPPWYRSWPAYFLYVALVAGGTYLFYQNQLRRRLEVAEAERLKSMDEFKNRFFTNITHEFRTPLTVILGMAEQVLSEEATQSHPLAIAQPLTLIRRNGENLLRLINQLLDLAKLESKNLKINYIQGDVVPYLHYISESLHSLASAQAVVLRVESKPAQIVMDYDPERLLQIVHNLLSNAIKFTPSGGHITLSATSEGFGTLTSEGFQTLPTLKIIVADTGMGIAPEDLPHLFDRFYQATNLEKAKAGGTGIGLALTKELVGLLGGEISVESPAPGGNKGTAFLVRLPIANNAPMASDGPTFNHFEDTALRSHPIPKDPTLPTLLIIEDNPDVMEYLVACLKDAYALEFAYNGRAGIEKALETIPDLIVSDVMMPEKDGFEVCGTLKNEERSSHIPIVLLTAKADLENRLAGLRRGADAYLAKPFHREELLVTLSNLLEQRKVLQLKYKNWEAGRFATPENPVAPIPPAVADVENAFLQKIVAHLERHLDDTNFGVPQLSREMGLSQSQLYRKIKALTDLSIASFIRRVRLQKGRQLIETSQKTIAEIAYEVGFSTPNYFSDAFLEEFGFRPNTIRN